MPMSPLVIHHHVRRILGLTYAWPWSDLVREATRHGVLRESRLLRAAPNLKPTNAEGQGSGYGQK